MYFKIEQMEEHIDSFGKWVLSVGDLRHIWNRKGEKEPCKMGLVLEDSCSLTGTRISVAI